MRVTVARSSGFCRGVRHAVETAERIAAEGVYVLGELVHNPLVTDEIARRGIRTVSSVEEVPAGATVILRSHGVGKRSTKRALHAGFASRIAPVLLSSARRRSSAVRRKRGKRSSSSERKAIPKSSVSSAGARAAPSLSDRKKRSVRQTLPIKKLSSLRRRPVPKKFLGK